MLTPVDEVVRSRRFLLASLVVLGALYPLTDPDLPLHLLVGEWIARHREVPTVEPFAWTRAGEPYFAYSWLPQILSYGFWLVAGALGLRLFYGLLLAGAAAAMMRLARMAEWPRGVTMVMVALHIAAFSIAVPSLRPQAVLFITVPLVWSAVLRLLANPACRRSLLVLLSASTISAASHIFFPLTVVPLIGLWVGNAAVRTVLKAAAAVVAGWLLSPYALRWPEVFALNFSPNPLLTPDSPIAELRSGFSLAGGPSIEMAFVIVVSIGAVWGVLRGPLSTRARVAAMLLLVVGIGGFAYATRLIVIFWLLVAPIIGHVMTLWMESDHRVKAMRIAGVTTIVFIIVSVIHPRHLGAWTADGIASRALAWPIDQRTASVSARLACTPFRRDTIRVFTRLRYGNVLAWQLRPNSISIDTRTIFPDSVARAELLTGAPAAEPLDLWRYAEAVVLDRNDRLAPVLDTTFGWTRVVVPGETQTPALWVDSLRIDHENLRKECW